MGSNAQRVLVTGGCGFIGSHVVRELLGQALPAKGGSRAPFHQTTLGSRIEKVVNLDLLTYAGNPQNLEDIAQGEDADERYVFVKGDIGNEALVQNVCMQHNITHVLHLAAESHVDRSIDSPEAFFQTNVVGTLRLLNGVKRYWQGLPKASETTTGALTQEAFRFVHVSTDEVYGTLSPTCPAFTETTPYAPNSPYAASKAGSDFVARSFMETYGLPVVTTNCSNNYGPYQFPEKLIPLVVLSALAGKPLPVYGDGQQVRDWLYVADHAGALVTCMLRGQPGQTYNVGGFSADIAADIEGIHFKGEGEVTNLQVVESICEELDAIRPLAGEGNSYKNQIKFVADRPGHDRRYAVSATKIARELGWQPTTPFIEGLRATIHWYLANPHWCQAIQQGTYQGERLGMGQ